MTFRDYDSNKDKEAAYRIWREAGWLKRDEKKEEAVSALIECDRALVAEVNGEAECLVTTAPGTIRYLDQDLSFSCITGVTTSRVARKQGLASRLTALAVAADAAEGALVAFQNGEGLAMGLGAVEQADRLAGTIIVRTPLPSLEGVASVRFGAARWDLRNRQEL